ncbi:MAG: hypothetical protein DWQ36_23120 [Acidobacteria bacterium]|nr:MAG: hypothetical protein DWQ30_21535 [Acidobacteriota bacterium]REK00460.1 MAG: hypothetical protein DWQ36_23120 [Acidobacteriota bacterium]
MSYQLEQKRTFAFLRLPFEAKRRRVRPWLVLIGRFSRPLLVLLLCASFTLWLRQSPRFALAHLEIELGPGVRREVVEQRLGGWVGSNLFTLDLESVRARLAEDPWIGEISLHKRLPDRLVVQVAERRPVAVWELSSLGEAYFVDEEGRTIAPLAGRRAGDLLVLRSPDRSTARESRARALAVARRLAERPAAGGSRHIDAIEILSTGDLRLDLRAAEFPIVLGPGDPVAAIERFERLWNPLVARGVVPAAVDLRFAGRVVVEPAQAAEKQES